VVEGNKRTSLRQDVQAEMERRGTSCQCIRCREVKERKITLDSLEIDDLVYPAGAAQEHFLSFLTNEQRIAGFLRLSLPGSHSPETGFVELAGAAIIREVHVYGQSIPVGGEEAGAAQHIGLGTQLIRKSGEIARQNGFRRLAVISAVGTRRYYERLGFQTSGSYMVKEMLDSENGSML
jgi:elongator complex protein 3